MPDLHPGTVYAPHCAGAVAYLPRGPRDAGMGWRCSGCGRTWTLVLFIGPIEPHVTPYGTHGRDECGQLDTPYEWCTDRPAARPARRTAAWRPDPMPSSADEVTV